MNKLLLIFVFIVFITACTADYKVIERYSYTDGNIVFCFIVIEKIKTEKRTYRNDCTLFLLSEKYKIIRHSVLAPMWTGIE